MAKKNEMVFLCQDCGNDHAKWVGKCKECRSVNIKEMKKPTEHKSSQSQNSWVKTDNSVKSAADIKEKKSSVVRIDTQMSELNNVLGGGLTKGSVVLIGGDPGVGKSTLLIQTLAAISEIKEEKCLYVTGEESLDQVSDRGERLKLNLDKMKFLPETCVENIIAQSQENNITTIVVDSIQTMYTETIESAAGSPSQVKESTAKLTSYAKNNRVSIIIVGHVNKDGEIAGPKVLEHIVDTVLSFEGESGGRYRMLRSIKNRFGKVNELGVFAMVETGLKEVKNPSALFLSSETTAAAGSSIMVIQEGNRPLLFEVQSLVNDSFLESPMLVPIGLNYQRVRMLLAIMQKHAGITTSGQDVYTNIVGGVQISNTETSSDLPLCFSLLSSIDDLVIPKKIASFGELSLSGEVRPVPNGEERIKEAEKHGLEYIIVPKANTTPKLIKNSTIKIIPVTNIMEAIEKLQNTVNKA
jgi:DNA repair protein RadA/Sms